MDYDLKVAKSIPSSGNYHIIQFNISTKIPGILNKSHSKETPSKKQN